jgi:voltage-gated potassium channel
MYYMLSTLSTVGYGDLYPYSMAEKIVGAVIQILGVTFFSVVMNNFIGVVMGMKDSERPNNEDLLAKWLHLIAEMKN